MTKRIEVSGLQVAESLYSFIRDEALEGTGVTSDDFWQGLADIVVRFRSKNRELLAERDRLQAKIDRWHMENPSLPINLEVYRQFLADIGYLVPEGEDFVIDTTNVDDEIATLAGPQLVVPLNNARFALNAANARWGSLFDAFYGTDVINEGDGCEKGTSYNPVRGKRVVALALQFLDQAVPLASQSHRTVNDYRLHDTSEGKVLRVELADGSEIGLQDPGQLVGYRRTDNGYSLLLCNHGLHIEIQIDRTHPVGKSTPSGIKDVVLESAISTIQDCEDSVAAVDAEDKIAVYRNWLGLMKGDLQTRFNKNGQSMTRTLRADRKFKSVHGRTIKMHGRSLLLVRNVGHLMTTDAILDNNGQEIPEGILDAMATTLCAIHDLKGNGSLRNSRKGSVYIVKPKMHGPAEVAFTNELFNMVEDVLGLPRHTIKVGVMDEERRTSVNLKACIREVKDRLVFINTGFLDRTGDEIHTSMEAGPVLPKEIIKNQPWLTAYEKRNVDIGLRCGLAGRAQIGKGMWPKPDAMAQMLETKWVHLEAGANCAWVPSPTAATLHAIHYHQIPVALRQQHFSAQPPTGLEDILEPPFLLNESLSPEAVQAELDNNVQGLLGYVVRWVDQGVGCSKVPDINNVGLMEDRATVRISSQHIANWLRHGICTKEQVLETLKRLAVVIDRQNSHNKNYRDMSPEFNDSLAFLAASDLIFGGGKHPNGYTEPVLHARRRQAKVRFVSSPFK